jgi:hypothetical protein
MERRLHLKSPCVSLFSGTFRPFLGTFGHQKVPVNLFFPDCRSNISVYLSFFCQSILSNPKRKHTIGTFGYITVNVFLGKSKDSFPTAALFSVSRFVRIKIFSLITL